MAGPGRVLPGRHISGSEGGGKTEGREGGGSILGRCLAHFHSLSAAGAGRVRAHTEPEPGCGES